MSPPVEYVPYRELRGRPHIIVDGAPLDSTVFTLSHWPVNQTPDALKRDTSTATVFAYLDDDSFQVDIGLVSNNHFDEDGLFSMFALCYPDIALEFRDLLYGASFAGDFGVYSDRNAARLCFIVEAFADKEVSPLPADTFSGCEARQVKNLYREMLQRLPAILNDIDGYTELWSDPDAHLEESESLIKNRQVSIREHPKLDLAVVSIPEDIPRRRIRRYLETENTAIHPFAIHNATDCNRLIRAQGSRFEFQYRYESWVQLVSRRPQLRVDLSGLAERLNELEAAHGIWRHEKVDEVMPRVFLEGTAYSGLSLDRFVGEVEDHLASAPIGWDPYDWKGDAAAEDG